MLLWVFPPIISPHPFVLTVGDRRIDRKSLALALSSHAACAASMSQVPADYQKPPQSPGRGQVPQVVAPAATARYNLVSAFTIIFGGFLVFVLLLLIVRSTFGVEWSTALVVAGITCTGLAVSLDDVAGAQRRSVE